MAGIAQAADITVLATPGVKEAYLALVPQFERASGNKVATTWAVIWTSSSASSVPGALISYTTS